MAFSTTSSQYIPEETNFQEPISSWEKVEYVSLTSTVTKNHTDSEWEEEEEDSWSFGEEIRRNVEEQLRAEFEADMDAKRQLWLKSILLQIEKSNEDKAELNKKHETEKQKLWDKNCDLIREKSKVEAALSFREKLAEVDEVRVQEVEEKYMKQKGKNLELAGELAKEIWTVNNLHRENGALQEKCRKLEKEKYELMEELREAKAADAYLRTLIMDSYAYIPC